MPVTPIKTGIELITKFVLKQFAKKSARKTGVSQLLKANDPIVQSNVKNIEIILKDMGINPQNLTSTDDILNAMNYRNAMMDQHIKQQFKGLDLDKGIKSLEKKDPFQGSTPKIVPKDKTLLKDSPERIAQIKAENKAAAERLRKKKLDEEPDDLASGGIAGELHLYDGGRARFDKGKKVDLSKRRFLKGTGATLGVLSALPFVGKFFKAAKTAAPAAEKIATVAGGIPEYASRLIEVVKNKGIMEIIEGLYKRNPPAKKYTYKGVEVTDDGLGNVAVRKEQTKTGHWYDEATDDSFVDDYVDREVGFEIRKGETVTNKKGKQIQTADEYNESTAKMQGDPEGGMDVSEVLEYIDEADHLELKKIADESLIKKASGGRASYTQGGLAHVLGV